jgi:hypothetical protein
VETILYLELLKEDADDETIRCAESVENNVFVALCCHAVRI